MLTVFFVCKRKFGKRDADLDGPDSVVVSVTILTQKQKKSFSTEPECRPTAPTSQSLLYRHTAVIYVFIYLFSYCGKYIEVTDHWFEFIIIIITIIIINNTKFIKCHNHVRHYRGTVGTSRYNSQHKAVENRWVLSLDLKVEREKVAV